MSLPAEDFYQEKTLVGEVVLNNERLHEFALQPDEMGDPETAQVLRACYSLHEKYGKCDCSDVEAWTIKDSRCTVNAEKIFQWQSQARYKTAFDKDLADVKEASLNRSIKKALRDAHGSGKEGLALVSLAQDKLGTIAEGLAGDGLFSLEQACENVSNEMERVMSGETPDCLICGDAALDDLRLLERGGVAVIAGRPSMGKSAFAQYYARGLARNGESVLLFPTETNAEKVARRYLSRESGINSIDIANAKLDGHGVESFGDALASSAALNIMIDQKSRDAASIGARIRQCKRLHGTTVVIVDHIQECIDQEDPNKEIAQFIHIVRDACREDHENQIALILVSQLNRGVEKREDKVPRMSDLRDSGSIEQAADSVILCYRPAYYATEEARESRSVDVGLMELAIPKNRDGKTCTVSMAWNYDNGYVNGVRSSFYDK